MLCIKNNLLSLPTYLTRVPETIVFLVYVFLILTSIGCRGFSPKPTEAIQAPEGVSLPAVEILLSHGTNYRAQFSPDGLRLIFISRNRPKHQQPQVYEYIFLSKLEKRLTYQDGEIYDAVYDSNKNYFYYSSTTDEIKENSTFVQNIIGLPKTQNVSTQIPALNFICQTCDIFVQPLPTTEIYQSHFDGSQIERLTQSQNFDGAISPRPNTHQLAFVSVRNKIKQLFILNTQTHAATPIGKLGKNDDSPAYSYNGKYLLWSHRPDDNTQTSEIWLGESNLNHSQSLLSGQVQNSDRVQNIDPSWHPNNEEFVFASNRDSSLSENSNLRTTNFEIYAAKKDGRCLRRLTYHTALDRWPVLSPDGKKLVFTSERDGVMQIYWTDYRPLICDDKQPSSRLDIPPLPLRRTVLNGHQVN